jgi:NADH:ubiquinone oxidoreductase subunit C
MNSSPSHLLPYVNSLYSKIPKYIDNVIIKNKKIIISVNPNYIISLVKFLQNHVSSQYGVLIDMTVVDRLFGKNRFEIYYFFRSMIFNNILTIKFQTDGLTALNSLTQQIRGASWLEREIWDMFGIAFSNHSDLRRILTDYGFQGFPLRKDFPLTGFIEVRYDDESKRVIYDSLELSQEFRFFDFQSPWQNSEFNKISL